MNTSYDHIDRLIHKRTAELVGGEDEYRRIADEESKEVMDRWNKNTELLGRILRAHLFVEQFLTENLQHANPSLGSIEKASIGFAQKIKLLNPEDSEAVRVTPGLQRLNSIRNRLAHQGKATVTQEDATELLKCEAFSLLLRDRRGEKFHTLTPIEVVEDFARFAAIALSQGRSRLVAASMQAIKELSQDREVQRFLNPSKGAKSYGDESKA